jgi:hypothetical protein
VQGHYTKQGAADKPDGFVIEGSWKKKSVRISLFLTK